MKRAAICIHDDVFKDCNKNMPSESEIISLNVLKFWNLPSLPAVLQTEYPPFMTPTF